MMTSRLNGCGGCGGCGGGGGISNNSNDRGCWEGKDNGDSRDEVTGQTDALGNRVVGIVHGLSETEKDRGTSCTKAQISEGKPKEEGCRTPKESRCDRTGEEGSQVAMTATCHGKTSSHKSRQQEYPSHGKFPLLLYRMIEHAEDSGNSDVVRFFSHGRAFKIHHRERFENEILPLFFPQQSKITSFLRQLALYGFRRMNSGIDQGGYWHPLFQKGRMDLCRQLKRSKNRGEGAKKKGDTEEPDNSCPENTPSVASRMEWSAPAVMPYPNYVFWMPIVQPMAFIPPPTPFALFPNMNATAQVSMSPQAETTGGWVENQKLGNMVPNHSIAATSEKIPFASVQHVEGTEQNNDAESNRLFQLFGRNQEV